MRLTGLIIESLVLAAIVLIAANALFYAPSYVRWEFNRPAVIREIETRNKFWRVAYSNASDRVPPPSQEKKEPVPKQEDVTAQWYELAKLIGEYDESVLRLSPRRIGNLAREYYSLNADRLAREDNVLDWAIRWHDVYAETATYDYRGELVGQRGSWCVMGQSFTRTFAYELALFAKHEYLTDIWLSTSHKPPVAPIFVVYDETVVPLFPVNRQSTTWIAALIQLAILASILFGFNKLVLLPAQQRQEILAEEQHQRAARQKKTDPPKARPLTAAVRNAPGPMQLELDKLLALERQLVDASAGYGQDLPELARVRALIQKVRQANLQGKMLERAEPGSPVAPLLESASDTMDMVEALLDLASRRPST